MSAEQRATATLGAGAANTKAGATAGPEAQAKEAAGPGAGTAERLGKALDALARALPYLRATSGPPAEILRPGEEVADGKWFRCDELLGGPAWLRATVAATGRRLGAPNRTVAASLFVQGYAYRVLTVALSCFFLGGVLPGSRPDEMAMALSHARPALVAYRVPRVVLDREHCADNANQANELLEAFTADALEGHVRPLVLATLSAVRVGKRLLWGNVAASAAVAFRTMEGLLGGELKPLGERFFQLAPPELHGLGNFVTVEGEGRSAWYWERRSCCLYDRLPGKVRCTDCPKVSPEERRAAYRAGLVGQ